MSESPKSFPAVWLLYWREPCAGEDEEYLWMGVFMDEREAKKATETWEPPEGRNRAAGSYWHVYLPLYGEQPSHVWQPFWRDGELVHQLRPTNDR